MAENANVVPFSTIFSYPYFWKASKICQLITADLSVVTDNPKNLDSHQSKELRNSVNSNSNSGTVDGNSGTVNSNSGTVDSNSGTVDSNPGTVYSNSDNKTELKNLDVAVTKAIDSQNPVVWQENSWKAVLEAIKCDILEDIREEKNKPKEQPADEQTKEKIANTHYDILSMRYIKKKTGLFNEANEIILKYGIRPLNHSETDIITVSQLFKLIRDKHQHADDFPPDRKHELGWFTADGNLNEHRLVEYWTSYFPRLFPFLWIRFHPIRRDYPALEGYYRNGFENLTESCVRNLPVNLDGVLENIDEALLEDVKLGGMDMRYTGSFSGENLTLEFRYLPVNTVQELLGGSATLTVTIGNGNLTCQWYRAGESQPTDCRLTWFETSRGHGNEHFIFIIGTRLCDIESHVELDKLALATNRIVVFTAGRKDNNVDVKDSKGMAQVAQEIFGKGNISHFCNPLKGNEYAKKYCKDLSPTEIISKWEISLYGKPVRLENIIPKANISDLLKSVEGDTLNKLLRKHQPKVFEQCCSSSSPDDIYLQRRISKRIEVKWERILKAPRTDVFVLANIRFAEALKNSKGKRVSHINTSHPDGKFRLSSQPVIVPIYVPPPSDKPNYNEIMSAFAFTMEDMPYINFNIHFLDYVCSGTFKWMNTQGNRFGTDIDRKYFNQTETDFLNNIQGREWEEERIVVISDKPGMGKSFMVRNIGRRIREEMNTDKIVLVVEVDAINFANQLCEKSAVNKQHIISVLLEMACVDKFEREILNQMLKNKDLPKNKDSLKNKDVRKVQINILFDGLDEILDQKRETAMEALKIIKQEIPRARVWATARDHMVPDLHRAFGCLAYKLEPFTWKDQINFLETYWLQCLYRRNVSYVCNKPDSENLHTLAVQCINIPFSVEESELAGIPLQCSFIAEIYEEQVMRSEFNLEAAPTHSLLDLYNKLIIKKWKEYHTNKCKEVINWEGRSGKILLEDMIMSHTYFAIKLLFSEKIADSLLECHLLSIKEHGNTLKSALTLQGLILSFVPLKFMHRTIAEYFVARYVVSILTENSSGGKHKYFQYFLWQVLGTTNAGSHSYQLKFPHLFHFLSAMCRERKQLICYDFDRAHIEIREICQGNFFKNLFVERITDAPEIFAFFQASMFLDSKMFALLFTSFSGDRTLNFLLIGLRYKLIEFCKFLIHTHPECAPTNWSKVQEHSENKDGILHCFLFGMEDFYQRFYENGLEVTGLKEMCALKEFIHYLIENKAGLLSSRNSSGETPFLLLIKSLFRATVESPIFPTFVLELVTFFVDELKVDVNLVDSDSNSVLHVIFKCRTQGYEYPYAKYWDYEKILPSLFKLLHDHGLNFNLADVSKNTALHIAAATHRTKIITDLIDDGADILIEDANGKCALHLVVESDDVFAAKYLIEKEPSCVAAVDNQKNLAINYAISQQMHNILEDGMRTFNASVMEVVNLVTWYQ